jgi:hypothetical protein
VIPDALGINDSDGAAHADFQAIGFRAIDSRVRTFCEAKFLETAFQEFPGRSAFLFRTALRLRLFRAEKNVARAPLDPERLDAFTQIIHGSKLPK